MIKEAIAVFAVTATARWRKIGRSPMFDMRGFKDVYRHDKLSKKARSSGPGISYLRAASVSSVIMIITKAPPAIPPMIFIITSNLFLW